MPFKVSDKQLFKRNTKIWEKFSNLMNIEFDSEPVYGNDDKYIKTKIRQIETFKVIKYQKKMHHISVYL